MPLCQVGTGGRYKSGQRLISLAFLFHLPNAESVSIGKVRGKKGPILSFIHRGAYFMTAMSPGWKPSNALRSLDLSTEACQSRDKSEDVYAYTRDSFKRLTFSFGYEVLVNTDADKVDDLIAAPCHQSCSSSKAGIEIQTTANRTLDTGKKQFSAGPPGEQIS